MDDHSLAPYVGIQVAMIHVFTFFNVDFIIAFRKKLNKLLGFGVDNAEEFLFCFIVFGCEYTAAKPCLHWLTKKVGLVGCGRLFHSLLVQPLQHAFAVVMSMQWAVCALTFEKRCKSLQSRKHIMHCNSSKYQCR